MGTRSWDAIVVGGGFFGAYLALLIAQRGRSVLLLEREAGLLTRASYNNQARVHAGYHYPRSLMTAVRSQVNFPLFIEDFADCVITDFQKYYAIARGASSKVTADQFALVMDRVGAPIARASDAVERLFNPELIEAVFSAKEFAFDARKLAHTMTERLSEAGVATRFGVRAERLGASADGSVQLHCEASSQIEVLNAEWVFNCTYSAINGLRLRSGLPLLPLKQELAEMALVEPPKEIDGISVTVMCGPYFSLMPFPDRKLWTLSHVRYTPHASWRDDGYSNYQDPKSVLAGKMPPSHGPMMFRDAARYMPLIARSIQHGSIWEVKSVLPQSEGDDSRPILFHRDPAMRQLITVLGGKLDNVYDLPQELDLLWPNHERA